ncbi:CrcB family protein [Sporosarcina sp. FSL W7-1349]|uniref:fluoride efflux transporter FluC n=1 Tax=Sporosarcina sp. FSL W7-1349 TaxID=2921561 RepID=UPI0030F720C1
MNWMTLALVCIGGFIGAVSRYWIAQKWNAPKGFPKGTFIANLAGSVLIGLVFGLPLSIWWKALGTTGIAGSLTTFSTLTKEWWELWRSGQKRLAILYLLLTYGAGISLVYFGYFLGGSLFDELKRE